MTSMRETLNRANEVTPISEKEGIKVVSYEDASILQQEQMLKDKMGEDIDLGDVEINPDGTIAKTRLKVLAMNEDRRLDNRFRTIGKKGGGKLLQVVTDYRIVAEKMKFSRVPMYEFERGEDGKLQLIRETTVSYEEYLEKFTDRLNNEAMHEILRTMARNDKDVSRNEMPI